MAKTNIPILARTIATRLRGVKYVTAEGIADELKEKRADIHRAMKLLTTQGWSFRPSNHVAYERRIYRGEKCRPNPIWNRGRKKGERYNHDYAEPYWTRTSYLVREPKKVAAA